MRKRIIKNKVTDHAIEMVTNAEVVIAGLLSEYTKNSERERQDSHDNDGDENLQLDGETLFVLFRLSDIVCSHV